MPIGTEKNSLFAAAGVSTGNYFGSGSDGDLTTSGNTNLTVQNGNGAYDGDMVVMNYNDLTVSAGHTLTTSQPCRGLLIYVKGNCVINGTLSMDARGPAADPTATTNWNAAGSDGNVVNANGLRLPMFTASGSQTLAAADFAGCGTAAVTAVGKQPGIDGDGTIFQVVRQGAGGGGGGSGNPGPGGGNNGTNGTGNNTATFQTGGGGGGEGGSDGSGTGTGGGGGYGSCWSGGSGGGGAFRTTAGGGSAWGGAGAAGASQNNNNGCGSGGAGNPGGNGVGYCPGYTGATGTGGLLILIVKGNLTVGNAGLISAKGVRAGTSGGGRKPGGGSSGGGVILILHGGTKTYTGSGTWSTAGGTRSAGWSNGGGAGGNGNVVSGGGIAVTVG